MAVDTGYTDMLTPEELAAMELDEKSLDDVPEPDGTADNDGASTTEADEEAGEEAGEDEEEAGEEAGEEEAGEEAGEEEAGEEAGEEEAGEDEEEAGEDEEEAGEDEEAEEAEEAEEEADGSAGGVVDEVAKAALFALETPDVVVATPTVAAETADITERIAEISSELEALSDKVNNGDIEISEYVAEQSALMAERIKLETGAAIAEQQAAMSQQQIQAQWEADVRAFLSANPVFSEEKNPALFGALDANIKAVAASDDAANMSNRDILRAAASRVHEQLQQLMPTVTEDKAKDSAKPKRAVRKNRAKQVRKSARQTPSVRDVSPAASNEDSGEFAYLDKLEGAAYEEALAKLSADKLNKYLAA